MNRRKLYLKGYIEFIEKSNKTLKNEITNIRNLIGTYKKDLCLNEK